jgi:glycosyltransferase involved in cell wall biosynthesis
MKPSPTSDPRRGLGGARVAVVNWRDPWHSLAGGSERYAWEFATALSEAGAHVDFLTARDAHQSAAERHGDVRVRRGGSQFSFYPWVWWQLLRRTLTGQGYDVVVDAENGIPVFSPPLLPRRAAVVLVMHHVHQEQFRTYFTPPLALLGRWLEAWLMPRVYWRVRTLAVSQSTYDEMVAQLGWRRPVEIVHNGSDTPADVGAAPDPDRIVVLGRLATHKRIDLVIRAIQRLVAEQPTLRLDIVGKGPEESRLRALVAELGLDEHVRLHGYLDEDDKHRVLGRATFHVCASDAEGWGQVVIEAAAYGLPTLARDVPGLRDSIHHGRTGWLVDTTGLDAAGVVDALVAGMRTAQHELERPADREGFALRSREWADRFSWKHMHDQVVQVVSEELDRAQRRRGR